MSISRHIVTNHLLHFLALDRSDPKKFQILQLIAALLQWTEGRIYLTLFIDVPSSSDIAFMDRSTRTSGTLKTGDVYYYTQRPKDAELVGPPHAEHPVIGSRCL
jgi:hypothetical protein